MDLRNEIKTVIRSLLISSPKPLTINDLDSDFMKSEGQAIPFFTLGYSNLKQFLLSIPDVLTISYTGDIIPVDTEQSYHIKKLVASNASRKFNRYNNDDDLNWYTPRLHPRIKIDYSSRNFNHDHKLNNQMTRFDDAKPLQVTDLINRDEKSPTKGIDQPPIVDAVVVRKQLEIKEQKQVRHSGEGGADQALPFIDKNDPIHFIGLGLSNGGVKIPSPPLTEFKSKRTYDVFVTEVNQPWSFWFCLCGDKKEFEQMEQQLKMSGDNGNVKMQPFEMVEGNACLVSHQNKVLRAEFLGKPANGKVKVCFVDYGTVDVVDISKCRRINKYFVLLPRMCFPGALHLGPIKNVIERKAMLVERFCEMVRNKPMCGYVTQVDPKNNLVRMVLIDTSDERNDVIVNRELVAD